MSDSKEKLWGFPFTLVVLITCLFFLSLHMLNAGFPPFVTESTNNPVKGGMMTTAFMAAAILTRPIVSMFLHKINMKKTAIITMVLTCLWIVISYGMTSFPLLIIIRVLEGAGFGIVTTILATIITNIIPKDRLGEGIGFFGMATSLGASLAPVIALSALNLVSFNLVLLISFIVLIIILFATTFIGKEYAITHKKENKSSLIHYVYDKKAILPSMLVFLLCVTFSGVFNFMNGLGEEAGLGTRVSLFFFIFMVMMVLIRPLSGRIFDKKGHRVIVYPASIIGVLGLLVLAITNNVFMLVTAGLFYGIAYGAIHPTLQSWAVKEVSPDKKGTANAMILSCMDLGMALGAPFLGMVANVTSYKTMYAVSSLFLLVLIISYGLGYKKRQKVIIFAEKGNNNSSY